MSSVVRFTGPLGVIDLAGIYQRAPLTAVRIWSEDTQAFLAPTSGTTDADAMLADITVPDAVGSTMFVTLLGYKGIYGTVAVSTIAP